MNRDAYRTPPEIFAYMDAEFDFQLDVAASRHNALCEKYIDESLNALSQSMEWLGDESCLGSYVWCNPPYSDIGPWVKKAAEQSKQNGVGVVMLVMMDQSVGWYKDAIATCQEVRLVIGGRLAFLDPETDKPVSGNNKGSMFLIWHPFGRTSVQHSHIERDEMLAKGHEMLKNKGEL